MPSLYDQGSSLHFLGSSLLFPGVPGFIVQDIFYLHLEVGTQRLWRRIILVWFFRSNYWCRPCQGCMTTVSLMWVMFMLHVYSAFALAGELKMFITVIRFLFP